MDKEEEKTADQEDAPDEFPETGISEADEEGKQGIDKSIAELDDEEKEADSGEEEKVEEPDDIGEEKTEESDTLEFAAVADERPEGLGIEEEGEEPNAEEAGKDEESEINEAEITGESEPWEEKIKMPTGRGPRRVK